MADTLEGTIERVTYYSEESGYTVLRVKPHKPMQGQVGRDGLATVVGTLPALQPGESVRFSGAWVTHSEYGKQFKAERVEQIAPATLEGLRRYLASGAIPNIGSKRAKLIVDHFGINAIEILDREPHRLLEVPGIGTTTAQTIAEAWAGQAKVKEVMVFLQGHGISASHAVKIHKEYGDTAISVVRGNPYQLARDISGIGFRTADQIARNLGLPSDSPARVAAGVLYALETLTNEGHVFAPRTVVTEKVNELLELPADPAEFGFEDDGNGTGASIDACIAQLASDTELVIQHVPDEFGTMSDEPGKVIEALYLRPMLISERNAARRLMAMTESTTTRLRQARTMSWIKFFQLLEKGDRIKLTTQQQDAVEAALNHKVSILTGGPGTGKTTTLRAVIRALETIKAKYALASPTGRAAKRLSEATGRPASTIHRLLGYMPGEGFLHNDSDPLDVDMLIIDEASMLDLSLFYNVLKAIAPDTHLMLVGDVDQLPSVGAGDVLRDLIRGGTAHVTRLDVIFRQAGDSLIISNAHRINRGEMPVLDNQGDDFFMFPADEPEAVAELVVDLVKNRIPNRFGFDPMNEVQVLAPMYRGAVGIQVLNEKLQAALNPPGRAAERKISGMIFRVGDKVMQTRNNYDKDVFNGDIGRIHSIDFTDQKLRLTMDERFVDYDFTEADELIHAFAVSVHRSQGSEYPAVVMPVMPQHYMMLQRNLLYTGVTRAKRLVVMVGQKRAIGMAVSNDRVAKRYSGLAWRLKNKQN